MSVNREEFFGRRADHREILEFKERGVGCRIDRSESVVKLQRLDRTPLDHKLIRQAQLVALA